MQQALALPLLLFAVFATSPAVIAQDVGKPDEALQELIKEAEQGDTGAQFKLGLRYARGDGVTKDDEEAVKWYRLAAEQGDAVAQRKLGFRYNVGIGVLEDF